MAKQSALTRWIHLVRDQAHLTKSAKLVAFVLSTYMDTDTLHIHHLSYGTIAAGASMTEESVRKALRELEDAGLLYVNRGQWKGSASSFRGRLAVRQSPKNFDPLEDGKPQGIWALDDGKAPKIPSQSPKETIPLLVSTCEAVPSGTAIDSNMVAPLPSAGAPANDGPEVTDGPTYANGRPIGDCTRIMVPEDGSQRQPSKPLTFKAFKNLKQPTTEPTTPATDQPAA